MWRLHSVLFRRNRSRSLLWGAVRRRARCTQAGSGCSAVAKCVCLGHARLQARLRGRSPPTGRAHGTVFQWRLERPRCFWIRERSESRGSDSSRVACRPLRLQRRRAGLSLASCAGHDVHFSGAAAQSVASWCIGSLGTGSRRLQPGSAFPSPLAGARAPATRPRGPRLLSELFGILSIGSRMLPGSVGQTAKNYFHEA